jgi:hypothetical protein
MGMIGNTLAQGLISGANIQDGTVDTADIKSNAITPSKLSIGAPTWDTSSNFGVGTTSPAYRLHVVSSSSQVARFIRDNTSNASGGIDIGNNSRIWTIYGDNSGLSFWDTTAAVERGRFDASGNFGIGATSLGGRIHTAVADGATNAFYAERTGASPAQFTVNFANQVSNLVSSSAMTFSSNGFNERARIEAGGDLRLRTYVSSVTGSIPPAVKFYTEQTNGQAATLAKIWSTSTGNWDGALIFETKPSNGSPDNTTTERARIDSSGNLLVGTSDGTSGGLANFIKVNGSSNPGYIVAKSGSNLGYLWYYDAGSTLRLESNNSNKTNSISIVANTGGVQLSSGATSWSSMSDERLKADLLPITNAVAKVASLRAVTGRFHTDPEETRRSFLIAQDVQAVLPEAVSTYKIKDDETDYLGLAYADTIPLLVAAITEQQAIIEQMQTRLAALEGA